MFDLVFLFVALVIVVSLCRAVFYAALRNSGAAIRAAAVGLSVGIVYATILVVTGLLSTERQLSIGEEKCFDDWCVSLESYRPRKDGYFALFHISNHGRFAQRPDTPRLFVEQSGFEREINSEFLKSQLEGHDTLEHELFIPTKKIQALKIILREGGIPTCLIIGDENGPFHKASVWIIP